MCCKRHQILGYVCYPLSIGVKRPCIGRLVQGDCCRLQLTVSHSRHGKQQHQLAKSGATFFRRLTLLSAVLTAVVLLSLLSSGSTIADDVEFDVVEPTGRELSMLSGVALDPPLVET